jgi:virulence-associated protein VagC
VRLPKPYRFTSQREVVVRREGRRVILEPADEWSPAFLRCLGSLTEVIPRPRQQPLGRTHNPFD